MASLKGPLICFLILGTIDMRPYVKTGIQHVEMNFTVTFILLKVFITVLNKNLKGICGVRLNNLKALCAPGARTKYFEPFLLLFNKLYYNIITNQPHQNLKI